MIRFRTGHSINNRHVVLIHELESCLPELLDRFALSRVCIYRMQLSRFFCSIQNCSLFPTPLSLPKNCKYPMCPFPPIGKDFSFSEYELCPYSFTIARVAGGAFCLEHQKKFSKLAKQRINLV